MMIRRLTVQGHLAVLACVLCVRPAFASCSTGTALGTPTWTQIDTSGNTGTYFQYANNVATETSGSVLSSTYQVPQGSGGSFSGSDGAFSASTYPSASPYALNNSSSVSFTNNATCIPGNSCDACEAQSPGSYGDYDCTGSTVARWPAQGILSGSISSPVGFKFTGSFSGDATAGTWNNGHGTMSYPIQEAVYLSTSPVYLGGLEFGIYTNLTSSGPSDVMFYMQSNSNCTDVFGNSICSSFEGGGTGSCPPTSCGVGTITNNQSVNCVISTNPTSTETYSVYLEYNPNAFKWDFVVNLANAGVTYVGQAPTDFQSAISSGYVTAGIVRFDPNNNGSYTTYPELYASSLYAGN